MRKQSQGRQIPWESTSLEDDFYFNRGVALAKPDEAAKLVAFNAQKADWAAIRDSTKPDDYFAFLQKHPQGELAEEAQFKLDRLARPKIVAALGKDQDANLAFSGERFQVGDEYGVQVKDILTGVPIRSFASRVSAIKGDVVEINDGAVLFTTLGGWIKSELIGRRAGGTMFQSEVSELVSLKAARS